MAFDEPAGKRIEHVQPIDALSEQVWAVLADLPGWAAWNPLSTVASGTMAVGETLDITVTLPGMKPQPAHARVIAVEPGRELRYGSQGAGGLMRAHRYFILEPAGAGCAMRNGEIFGGPMGWLVATLLGKKIHQGMAEMNRALKGEAERRRPARG